VEVIDDGLVGQIRSLHFDDKLLSNFVLEVSQHRVANRFIQPVYGCLIACQCGWFDRSTFLSADNFSRLAFRPTIECSGRRRDFHECFRGVYLRLTNVVSKVSFRNRPGNAPQGDNDTQTLMLAGLVLPITTILWTN
jgi:hypothetical protein